MSPRTTAAAKAARIAAVACTLALCGGASRAADSAVRLARGRAVFEQWCAACHGAGIEKPGTNALATKYGGRGLVALDQGPPYEPARIAYFVRHGMEVMPPFRKTEIGDADLADLAAWLARPR
jgi:mono/diheme cytochrome c family protein